MRAAKNLILYVFAIGLFTAGILWILRVGTERAHALQTSLQAPPQTQIEKPVASPAPASTPAVSATATAPPAAPIPAALEQLRKNVQDPLPLLLLQVVVIIAAARFVGILFARLGQPSVVGEMLAGILLGPSFFGLLLPTAQATLFPAASMGALRMLSQIGVIVFMFVVGIDLDVAHLRHRSQSAIWVSHASIIVPFFLGTGFALFAYRELAPPGAPFNAFALFLGIAMSITAFPVLARILEERGLSGTALGTTAIACAAVDDVTAWCLLAVVVAIAKSTALSGALVTIALSAVFVVFMLKVAKPLAARLVRPHIHGGGHTKALLAGTLSFVFLSALATEAIGIHALFGAFLAGVVMPAVPSVRDYLKMRLESFSSVLLLPLFFAFTGLRTQVGLLDGAQGWLLCLAVIAVAFTGKVGGTTLAARVTGMTWSDSFALGALMNTRGLVELIVLNLGYDLGILPPRIFAMMVLMALTTTFATGPLLGLHTRWQERAAARDAASGNAASRSPA